MGYGLDDRVLISDTIRNCSLLHCVQINSGAPIPPVGTEELVAFVKKLQCGDDP
jgi:hypothetical protein